MSYRKVGGAVALVVAALALVSVTGSRLGLVLIAAAAVLIAAFALRRAITPR